jgi:hypothetical protein
VWAFLDEINACDHLGFLNGVICHHFLDEKALDPNLVVLAACNPYRRHDKENAQAGFSPRDLISNAGDVQRYNLAYRVHPLPEAMLDYVWDFGLLSRHDEQAYIEAMVQEKVQVQVQCFADLLVQSQALVREYHGEASVSLRDASRCISLYEFFLQDLPERTLPGQGKYRKIQVRATLLAFAHCYHSRLATEPQRQSYRNMFAGVLHSYDRSYYRYHEIALRMNFAMKSLFIVGRRIIRHVVYRKWDIANASTRGRAIYLQYMQFCFAMVTLQD